MTSLPVPQSQTQNPLHDASSGEFDPAVHLTPSEQKDLLKDAKAYDSDLSDAATGVNDDTLSGYTMLADTATVEGFAPTRKLAVHSHGLPRMQLPLPSRQLEIDVEDLATHGRAYLSARKRTHSGDATLSAPGRGDLIQSLYKFGPGRAPKLVILNTGEEVNVKGKWTSREQTFAVGENEKFTWKYSKEVRPGAPTVGLNGKKTKPRSLLICEVCKKRVAMLVRDDETRTVGTKGSYSGNGGQLWMDEPALKAAGLTEELLVASCVMMLKKEMDRRRAVQFAAIAAMSS